MIYYFLGAEKIKISEKNGLYQLEWSIPIRTVYSKHIWQVLDHVHNYYLFTLYTHINIHYINCQYFFKNKLSNLSLDKQG